MITIINSLTARVVGAPQIILKPVFSIFLCFPLPSWTCRTPGQSIPWCCLPTSSSVCLVFFHLSLCLARWFWPDLMNGRHDHATAVCVCLRWSGGLRVLDTSSKSKVFTQVTFNIYHSYGRNLFFPSDSCISHLRTTSFVVLWHSHYFISIVNQPWTLP